MSPTCERWLNGTVTSLLVGVEADVDFWLVALDWALADVFIGAGCVVVGPPGVCRVAQLGLVFIVAGSP